jgi:hypothetical protein
MTITFRRFSAAAAAMLTAALCFGGAAQAQSKWAGPEEVDAMGAPLPQAELPRSVMEAAGAYRAYMQNAVATSSSFEDGKGVARTVRTGAAYEPQQLARGAVAYAAVVALQNRAFVRSVRAAGADPYERRELAAEIWQDPAAATQFGGAEAAAGAILSAIGGEGARLRDLGEDVRKAAYSVQLQPWSKLEVSGRDYRLAEAKALSDTPILASERDIRRLRAAVSGAHPLDLDDGSPANSYAPVVIRGLAVASLALLGEATDDNAELLDEMLNEKGCAECLRMSKLNLFQCLAVAKPWYEDIFCIGQHGLKDTGECIAASSREPEGGRRARRSRTVVFTSDGRRHERRERDRWRNEDGWSRF